MDGKTNSSLGSKPEIKEYIVDVQSISASGNVTNQPYMLRTQVTDGQTVVNTGFCKLIYPYKITIEDLMGVGATLGNISTSSIEALKNILDPIELEDGSYIIEVIPCVKSGSALTNPYRVSVNVLNSEKTITGRNIYGNIGGGVVLFISGISKIN